jgi:tRNA dimethylallyltransferase
MTAEEALLDAQTNTRRYAKRQITWFRKEPKVHWLAGFGENPSIQGEAIDIIREYLKKYATNLLLSG